MPARLILLLACACSAWAVRPKPESVEAFEKYLAETDRRARLELAGPGPFLWIDTQPAPTRASARGGEAALADLKPARFRLPSALVHHWVASVFAPGVTYDQTLAVMQDYPEYARFHQPYFIRSDTLDRGEEETIIRLRLYRKLIIKTALDTDHAVRYTRLDPARGHSRTHTVRIREVANPGEPSERLKPEGDGHGFLWRHVTWWRFLERDGGVWIQCEALSLSRDLPMGLNWLFGSLLRGVHREFLVDMVASTRRELARRYAK